MHVIVDFITLLGIMVYALYPNDGLYYYEPVVASVVYQLAIVI